MTIIKWLYEVVFRQPWTTTRSMAAEFGPTLATRFPELAEYSDLELLRREREDLIAEIEGNRAALVSLDALLRYRQLVAPYSTRKVTR